MLKLKLTRTRDLILRLFLIIILSLQTSVIGSAADSSTKINVLVLPFVVNAQSDLSYLRSQIATVLAEQLEKEGAAAITVKENDMDDALRATSGGLVQVREKAQAYNANQVIWGSFTLIDGQFSLDVRLMPATGDTPPQRFFAQGQNLENLITVTNDLADQIGLKLFHKEIVTEVMVKGNQRIEADAVLRVIKTQKGSLYTPATLSKDLRAIYAMGYFDDVRVEVQPGLGGKEVIFHVKEKPTVRRIKIKGNAFIDEEDIRNNLTINTGAILNIFKIRSNIDQIEALYKEKNYHKVKVDYKIEPLENNQADLEFTIHEGPKLYVTAIRFEGNKAFTDKELKKKLKVSEKGFFYWLTDSGDLDRAELDQDVTNLSAFYQNNGYINAKVGEPQIDIQEKGIQITFRIDEGAQYKVGRVDISGDLILPKDELLKKLIVSKAPHFSREKLRDDVLTLTDLYASKGYAYADISPRMDQKPKDLVVDIKFDIQKREQVYFEKIIIKGNTRTRDKVIRRELHVHEQGLFNSAALQRSIRNLYRLDYFEDIKVDTSKGSADDKMLLRLDVTEKPTGSFSFGAGYSSEESAFLTGSISQRNFLGRGQTLNFSGTVGGRTTTFVLSFTEPYLFDTPLAATVQGYNQDKEYDSYKRKSQGGGLLFGYPVADYTRFYWGYNLDFSEISTNTAVDASGNLVLYEVPDSIKELEGSNITSSANVRLVYDSRDRVFNTTEGSKHSISFEYAGLGGDIGFNKYIGQTMWYLPIYKALIGFANAKIGYVQSNDDSKLLPDYEKFYLGGINSMRGFGYQGIYLTEANQDGNLVKVGGEKMVQFNLELIFPLVSQAGVNGVIFYDTGNVYNGDIDLTDLRQSAGGGIRWNSPIAPIRLEYGFILDRREGEQSGQFEFTLGGSF